MPFLDSDLIDSLPYLTASTISVLPEALHQEIVHSLYFYILPFTISKLDKNTSSENFSLWHAVLVSARHSL